MDKGGERLTSNVLRWIDRVIHTDALELSRHMRAFQYLVRLTIETTREFIRDDCAQQAAALAYKLVFSLVPLLAISFSIFAALPSLSGVKLKVQSFLFQHFIPTSGDLIQENISRFSDNASAVGAIGFCVLAVIAVSLIHTVENSFNHIWHVRRRRSLFHKFTAFTAVLLWGPILIGVSIYLSASLKEVFFVRQILNIGLFNRISYLILPISVTWITFTLLNIVVPYTKVRLRPALTGALFAGTLWEVSKHGFNLYVFKVVSYSKVYGSLGVIPVFLVWVYLSWILVLFAAELTFTIQNFRSLTKKNEEQARGSQQRLFLAMRTAIVVARAFLEGRSPVPVEWLARELACPEFIAKEIAGDLAEGGILSRAGGEEEQFVPARSPATITLVDVARAIIGDRFLTPETIENADERYLSDLFARASREENSLFGALTLADALDALKAQT